MILRVMQPADAAAVAALHTRSWRDTYRGILADDYLDGHIDTERLQMWKERLAHADAGHHGLVADDASGVAGFVFALRTDRGTLVDNLHVTAARRGKGLGRALLAALAALLVSDGRPGPVHVEVFRASTGARAFYRRLGALSVPAPAQRAPDGSLVDEVLYTWPSAAALRDAAS